MKLEKINWSAMTMLLALSLPLAAVAQTTTFQSANFHSFATGEEMVGGGTMVRSADGVHATVSTSGLEKKSVYTGWWIVFNKPNMCAAGNGHCGLVDLGDEMVMASVFYATGFMTGTDGVANVSAQITAGESPVGAVSFFGPGLMAGNAFDAEIHLLFTSHSKVKAGDVAGQISNPCDPAEEWCTDEQAIQFNANPLP